MYPILDETLDRWIREVAPAGDLTCMTLGLNCQTGVLTFTAREETVVCGSEEVARIFQKCGAQAEISKNTGQLAQPGEILMTATGPVGALHLAWKIAINVLEYGSGIATRTRRLIVKASSGSTRPRIAATCKMFPGTKELSAKAVLAGGGMLHRLGLSDSILIFDHHTVFFPSFEDLVRMVPEWKSRACERKIIAEVTSLPHAEALAGAGVDGVQFDKVPARELACNVQRLRNLHPGLLIIAAGGVTESNVAELAETGVDVLATSAVYFGKPADIATSILPLSAG